jgi:pyrroline-5-carboxylate reductase
MDAETALKLARQTVLGSARLAIDSVEAPAVLAGHVATPGGATIEGVNVLNSSDFAAVIAECVKASCERTKELSGS